MKRTLVVACLLVLSTACNSKHPHTKSLADTVAGKKTTGIKYTCTMHPGIITDKPGTCPKCGMELVEKDNSK